MRKEPHIAEARLCVFLAVPRPPAIFSLSLSLSYLLSLFISLFITIFIAPSFFLPLSLYLPFSLAESKRRA